MLPLEEVRKVVSFTAELCQPVTARQFPAHLVNLVERLLPGVIIALDEIPTPAQYRLTHNLPMDPAASQRLFAVLAACYQENPIYDFIQQATDVAAIRVSDLASRQRFCRTTLYQEVFRPLDIEYQLHVVVPVKAGSVSLSLNHRHNFTDEQVAIFQMLAPEIARAYHQAQARSVPAIEIDDRLTPREREVLRWVREGKRNSEIGVILRISERTVEKHLEHLLAKLGVESRLAAALAPVPPPFESGAFHSAA